MQIRRTTPQDLPFLREMLFEAFFWRQADLRPPFDEFAKEPVFAKLLADWGRPGDTALVASEATANIGAAWYRFWTDDEHSYGYLGPHIPELSLAVVSNYRSRGVGRALLRSLIGEAQAQGVVALSLSVDPANRARQLYQSEGFTKAGQSGTSWTFVLELAGGQEPNAA
jgi:ribosomal protein S18 acetylase RimI-like enzyme